MDDIALIPYSRRTQSSSGQCQRCSTFDTHVIESVVGGWLCWDLGACNMRRPFPKARYWDRAMAEVID